jgi:hypothetical protein
MKQPDDRSRRRFLQASSLLGLAVAFNPGTTGEAAWEQPQLFSEEVRAGFKSLRPGVAGSAA